jgi:hypothetical protein
MKGVAAIVGTVILLLWLGISDGVTKARTGYEGEEMKGMFPSTRDYFWTNPLF